MISRGSEKLLLIIERVTENLEHEEEEEEEKEEDYIYI